MSPSKNTPAIDDAIARALLPQPLASELARLASIRGLDSDKKVVDILLPILLADSLDRKALEEAARSTAVTIAKLYRPEAFPEDEYEFADELQLFWRAIVDRILRFVPPSPDSSVQGRMMTFLQQLKVVGRFTTPDDGIVSGF